MDVSVELSLYPLTEGFVDEIEDFLERLRGHDDLTVLTTTMSTRVVGPYDRVFEVLRDEMRRTHERRTHAVFVAKFVGGDLRPGDGRYA
jgi:uncharacterized protein YqgV (UPF0045/DUF77 family)